jgi:hypothetical protein
MFTGKRVKVIKRAGRREAPAARTEKGSAVAGVSGAGARRETVTVVEGWVRDLRRKKVEEEARGFESLFGGAAQAAPRG